MKKLLLSAFAFIFIGTLAHAQGGEIYKYLNSADQALKDLHDCHDNLEKVVPVAIALGPKSKVRAPSPIEEAIKKCREDRGNLFNGNPSIYSQLRRFWYALEKAEADILGGGTQPFLPTLAPA